MEKDVKDRLTELVSQTFYIYIYILQRLVAEPSTSSRSDNILQRLLTGVLHAKDDKARKEMKKVISSLLRENTSNSSSHESNLDISRDTIIFVIDASLR